MTINLKPMLAGKAELDQIRFPVVASPKLDGVRCLAVDGKPMSRALKMFPNKRVQEAFAELRLHGYDGELIYGSPNVNDVLSKTITAVMKEDYQHENVLDYYIFDVWNTPSVPWMVRQEAAYQSVEGIEMGERTTILRLCSLESMLVSNHEELENYERSITENGYEGVMIRDPNAPYKYGRSTVREGYLLKIKRFEDAEAVIIGYEEEMENTNEAVMDNLGHLKRSSHKAGKVGKGRLGKWLVRGIKEFDGLEFKVGSGLTDQMAIEFWSKRDEMIGNIITYKYFATGVKDLPRHPVFKSVRPAIDMSE